MSSHDSHILSRDHHGAARLNYQHFLWKEALSFNIHPSIPLDPSSPCAIADVACGTGLWVSEVARALPNARVDGFDISLAHTPPRDWLPCNSRIVQWDMLSEPRDEWLAAYDIVHVRLVQLAVEHGDPRPLIRQMARLLKPGGHLQWDELETGGSYVLRTPACEASGVELPTMDRLVKMLATLNPWIGNLKAEIDDVDDNDDDDGDDGDGDGGHGGLFDDARLFRYRDPHHIARAFFDMHLTKDEEVAETTFKGTEQGTGIMRNITAMLDESKNGAVLCSPKVVLVCRRKET